MMISKERMDFEDHAAQHQPRGRGQGCAIPVRVAKMRYFKTSLGSQFVRLSEVETPHGCLTASHALKLPAILAIVNNPVEKNGIDHCCCECSHESKEIEMKRVVHTSPANDWFFVFWQESRPIVMPLAVWATLESGSVIGMVVNVTMEPNSIHELVSVPPVRGAYKHLNDLSDVEYQSLDARWRVSSKI